jgi:hypothetical protein
MHSRHATTAAQEELDTLANRSSPRSLTRVLTAATQPTPKTSTEPTLKTSAKPDALLPDAPAAAPLATEEWRIATGKAARWKAKAAEAKKKWTATPHNETPKKTNGGWGKKAQQLRNNTGNHHAAETWADVVRRGGINVQIVLGHYKSHGNGDPPPAFATTSTETIDFSIGFGFAALIYVSL